ncbi:MAG: CPBP family intramembrane metalloprotease, partial [Nanoarchaeota archaeon]|nr:CPBP family intramembrane metalloprotease [Nanoarchaeota archaeon]
EEIIFRGLFIGYFPKEFDKIKIDGWKLIIWIIVVNVFFALIHNLGAIHPKPVLELIKTFLLGIVLSVIYLKSKNNILYPSLLHLINNQILIFLIANQLI